MAKLFPSFDQIRKQKVQPTEGENEFLNFLVNNLNDDYEVFFQPFLNGDQPDIILVNKIAGILIIEVKDWNLNNYYLNPKNNWVLKSNKTIIESPLYQVQKYKENLYELHSEAIFEKKIQNKNAWSVVNCMVYFHNASEAGINRFLHSGEYQDYRYKNFLNYMEFWGHDSLNPRRLEKMLRHFRLNRKSYIFDEAIYKSCRRYLAPPFHELEEGKEINYTKAQKELIRSEERPYRKIKGAAGSGKTLVLAKRAVNAHKRTGGRVLILTYNLSLKNYIHDRISDVREEFFWNKFYITNYHQFFKTQANNNNIKITSLGCFQDTEFFKNKNTMKFDAIFIDEIQDYQQAWLDIITENFMHENSEFVVFGDEKQNIYERELDDNNEIRINKIRGNWNNSMNESHRFGSDIGKLALNFQKQFFKQKYKADDLNFLSQLDFEQRLIQQHIIPNSNAEKCVEKIYEILNANRIHSSDVAILGASVTKLRDIEYLIREKKKEKTAITFERKEEYEDLKKAQIEYLQKANTPLDLIEQKAEKDIYNKLEKIRRGRKNHFWMKTGTVKLSTIHSFKGWEINTLFLLVENDEDSNANAELIYTGLTRARQNLIILNLGNPNYQRFFESQFSEIGI
ncbi:nuclease-related domain-containing DEAD/DEAH box helicase [Autumnicola musiva]|uniref:DNA 3'-5' helicase II n=1 Tax=Autumnicola musiva TaxID=3075589 RepID=A0ABU3D6E4_9FLAO|nr:NERD domain-containing protein [Zunongwangia sp. F117]MDT0677001.1 NERD domain-containing protein [Zunongwangia sp. F117]